MDPAAVITREAGGRFAKGTKANPKGRGKLSPAVRELQNFTKDKIIETLSRVMLLKGHELQRMQKDPRSTGIELLAAGILIHAINKGDAFRAQFLMNYIIGRPVAFTDPMENSFDPIVLRYSNGEVISTENSTLDESETDIGGLDEEE